MPQTSGAEQAGPNAVDVRSFSCLTCRLRKVKCNRRNPCSNCTRAAKQCSFVPPVRNKPNRRSTLKEGLHAKLRRYEDMLKSYGADIELFENENNNFSDAQTVSESDIQMAIEDAESPGMNCGGTFGTDKTKTKLITKNGSSRYFENGPWPSIRDELRHSKEESTSESASGSNVQTSDILDDSLQESSLVLGSTFFNNESLASLHFPLHILQRLFDTYRDRVDPLIKLLHLPTFWSTLINALREAHEISKSVEAVIFSFYFVTIMSLEDEECFSLLGEQKPVMTAKYRVAARQALVNANFLNSSSLMTLQAYVIFLMGMRGHYLSNSLHILSGIAVRLARRMGLHRDGTMLKLSPFETEMKRRVWWHIVHFDFRTSDFSGTKPSMDLFIHDTKKPLNIEDEDISSDMTSPPSERTSITSVVLCLLRCDIMDFARKIAPPFSNDGRWEGPSNPSVTLAEKDIMINQMEDILETKYLRYHDPSKPLDFFSSIIARSSICKMKLLAHNPRQFANCGAEIPQKSRDIYFANGIKHLEYANLMYSNPILRDFKWQISTGYLWDTLHYVLIEIRDRKTGLEVDHAWQLVGTVFMNNLQIFSEATDTLYATFGNWTLQVWDDHVIARKAAGLLESPVPEFINKIRRCRRPTADSSYEPNSVPELGRSTGTSIGHSEVQCLPNSGDSFSNLETTSSCDFPNLLSFGLEPDEWLQWEHLFSGQAF